jgi:hypothetical protein
VAVCTDKVVHGLRRSGTSFMGPFVALSAELAKFLQGTVAIERKRKKDIILCINIQTPLK